MGNKINTKLENALEQTESTNLEKEYYKLIEKKEIDNAEKCRTKFVKNLAKETLGKDLPFSNKEFFKIFQNIKDREENEIKQQEDLAILKSKKYFGDKMGEVGRLAAIGASTISRGEIKNALLKTAAFAGRFTLIGISLGYLVKGAFEDEGSKLRKYTDKMVNNLRKELDIKVFQQAVDDFQAQIVSIQKMFDMIVTLVGSNKNQENSSGTSKSGEQENQLMISLIQLCDIVYEKIKQKKIFFKFSFHFIETFYNFALFHCALTKTAIDIFGLTMFEKHLSSYVEDYISLFKEYIEEAKRMRKECFTITNSESSFNFLTKIVANQKKIYEYLIDEFTSECLITTEKSEHIDSVVTENAVAAVSRIYHEINKLRPKFFDLSVIQIKIKEDVYNILTEKFDDYVKSLEEILSNLITK